MAYFRYNATRAEIREFWALVRECRDLGFTESSEVTEYIMANNLGERYQHIAGDLYLSNSRGSWTYPGGISPEYYGKLCRELNLHSQASHARLDDFRPFAYRNDYE